MNTTSAALEDHVRPRLFRVTDAAGKPLGSGFAVGGGVLTCAHVAEGRKADDLRVDGARISAMTVGRRADAAILHLERDVGGLALSSHRPDRILAAGFPIEQGLVGAVFSGDVVSGSADISYVVRGGRQHHVEGVWTLGDVLMSPGCSGGPIVDIRSGAVAGIAVANFRSTHGHAGPSGFVLPISQLLDDELLGDHLERAMKETARYGPHPNLIGATAWCGAATAAEIVRMEEERLYDREGTVLRLAVEEGLSGFLAGSAPVWALVDLSGLGKSTALASVAERVVGRPVLLLRAMEVEDVSGLDAMVQRKLAAVAPPYVLESPALAGLAAAGGTPLVIVDGLNEAALDVAQMRDRWLPQAVRDASGCKVVVSCRPESWRQISERVRSDAFHRVESGGTEDHRFTMGEFTDDEWRAFVTRRFDRGSDQVRRLRNPLLLEMASELQDVPDVRTGRWDLLERWIARDCVRAVDRAGTVSARMAEDTLERIAATCLEKGRRTLSPKDPITREAAFDPLLRQHLLIREGTGFGFRYDVLFEHLAARSLVAEKLELRDGDWLHDGLAVDWSVVESFSQSLARSHDDRSVDLVWSQLDAQRDLSGWKAARLLAFLPVSIERETAALRILERSASKSMWGFSLIDSDVADADWRHAFASAVLHLAVRSASGYDFRENDLFEPIRFGRDRAQFDAQGFRRYVASMLSRDRIATLRDLGGWHVDEERLGTIWGDTTRESTVSSWTSCCFVFCSELLTDEELLSTPSPRHSRPVFAGLARLDPSRMLRLARRLAADPEVDPARLRAGIGILDLMSERLDEAGAVPLGYEYADLACELALERYDDLGSYAFRNEALAWCASKPERQEGAWARLVELAEERRADSGTLQAFLPFRSKDVIDLARRMPVGFATHSGNVVLDLARSRFGSEHDVADEIASLRAALMREYVSKHGLDKEACQALEDMLYALSVEQADRLGVVDLALEAVRVGPDASPLVFFAGDQNKAKSGGEQEISDRLARAYAEHSNLELAEQVLMLRVKRASAGRLDDAELGLVGSIASEVASRFGPAPLASALKAWSVFLEMMDRDSLIRLCEAVRGDLTDAELDGVIATLLI